MISSNLEEWSKTLKLVSSPVARLVLQKQIANELAGQGIEIHFADFLS